VIETFLESVGSYAKDSCIVTHRVIPH